MFTIRHKELGGHEGIHGGIEWINYNPEARELSVGGKSVVSPGECKSNGDYGYAKFGNGTVYVMNENGKTVAVYDLDR